MGDLGDIVNTSDIINDLTTGGIDKPLSAEQGKTLNTSVYNNAVNLLELFNNRGYINIPVITVDIRTRNINGWCRGINLPNAPTTGWIFYHVTIMGDKSAWGYGFIEAYDYVSHKQWVIYCSGGVWGSWLRYASSDHVMWNYIATGGAKNNVDFNSLTGHGEYILALTPTNGPTTESYWDVLVFGGGELTQIAKNIVTGKLYNRVYKSPAWQPWAEIVQESYYIMTNSDLRNSWVIYSQVSVTRQGNLVTIEGVIQGGTRTDGVLAMVLPIGFRPTGIRHIFSLCTPGSGSSKCIGTQIGTDGAVALTYGASDQYVLLNLSFRI